MEQEKVEDVKPIEIISTNPKKIQTTLVVNRFSNIFSNMTYFATIFSFLDLIGSLLTVLMAFVAGVVLFAVLMIVSIATLGLIYVTTDFGKAWSLLGDLTNNTDKVINFFTILQSMLPYISGIGCVVGIVSIIFLKYSNIQNKKLKIVWSSICLGILAILFVLSLIVIGGGVKWTI